MRRSHTNSCVLLEVCYVTFVSFFSKLEAMPRSYSMGLKREQRGRPHIWNVENPIFQDFLGFHEECGARQQVWFMYELRNKGGS